MIEDKLPSLIPRWGGILFRSKSRHPTLLLHNLCLKVLTMYGNEFRQFMSQGIDIFVAVLFLDISVLVLSLYIIEVKPA